MAAQAVASKPFIDMKDYSAAARRYWWTIVPLGLASLAWAMVQVGSMPLITMMQVLGGGAIAAVVGLFPVRIPNTKISIGGGEIFIFLMLLLFGAAAAVLAAALEGFVGSCRTSKRWTSRLGTPAMSSISMTACAGIFEALRPSFEPNGIGTAPLLALLIVFATCYFAANTLLTSMLLALKTRAPITPIAWVRRLSWIGLAYATWASLAGLLYLSFQQFGLPVLLVAIPVIAMFLTTLHSYYERREAHERHVQELKESESRFHSAFTHAAIGMALVNTDGRFLQANKAFCDMLGRSANELLSDRLGALLNIGDLADFQGMVHRLTAGEVQSAQVEVRGRHRDGSDVWMALSLSLARDWQIKAHNLIVQAQDVTARRRAEAELYHNAYHDSLTQLANRTHFHEQLHRAIARVSRHPELRFAVMYLDFDRFKVVNDSLGHKAGDQLLVNLASRLKANVRPTDLVARLGGDEFAILLEDLVRERDAVDLTERIQKDLERPFELNGMEVAISASIGITFSSQDYQSAEQIIRDADIAMYKAKSSGKAQYAIFDSSLHLQVAQQLKLETELRRALSQGHIRLDYQPIYTLVDRGLVGFEALVRWDHPERGLLLPESFIPIAEETGLIVPLGEFVLHEACRQLAQWHHDNGRDDLHISVNVSGLQLMHRGFPARVRQALADSGLAPRCLTLEVTESVLMDGVENALPALMELRGMGVMLSIDDFGTGYSSLSYLARLPIDALKIDRSFIENMEQDGERSEIVKAIFKLGQALSKQVVAEGIETGAQLDLLRELGCELGQGYLLSRPMNAERAGGVAARSGATADA
jgi:diguanylate cyclase (GGDEF)-like protein/PAS domain S-box-containing protein